MSRGTSTRFDRRPITIRTGFASSDSSRRSSTMGSLRSAIWEAICSMTREPETWYGSAVTMTAGAAPRSRSQVARRRTVPVPVR